VLTSTVLNSIVLRPCASLQAEQKARESRITKSKQAPSYAAPPFLAGRAPGSFNCVARPRRPAGRTGRQLYSLANGEQAHGLHGLAAPGLQQHTARCSAWCGRAAIAAAAAAAAARRMAAVGRRGLGAGRVRLRRRRRAPAPTPRQLDLHGGLLRGAEAAYARHGHAAHALERGLRAPRASPPQPGPRTGR